LSQNELELDIDDSGAKRKLQELRVELQQLTQQAKELRDVLSSTSGNQKQIIQGALSGIGGRIGAIQSQLGEGSGGGVVTGSGGMSSAMAGAIGVAAISAGLHQGIYGTSNVGNMGSSVGGGAGNALPPGGGIAGGGNGLPPFIGYSSGAIGGGGGGGNALVPLGFGGSLVPQGNGFISRFNPVPTSQQAQNVYLSSPQNVYGGAGALNPFTGFGYNRYTNDNMRIGGAAALYGISDSVGRAIHYSAQRDLQGSSDPLGYSSNIAHGISTAIGVGAFAATGNPWVGLIAGGLSDSVLQPISEKMAAPAENQRRANLSLMPYLASRYGAGATRAEDFFTADTHPGIRKTALIAGQNWYDPTNMSRIERVNQRINESAPEALRGTTADYAAGLSGFQAGLAGFGIDPMAKGGTFYLGDGVNDDSRGYSYRAGRDTARGFGSNNFPGLLNPGAGGSLQKAAKEALRINENKGNIDWLHGASDWIYDNNPNQRANLGSRYGMPPPQFIPGGDMQESVGETYQRRTAQLFGSKIAPEMQKHIMPLFDPYYGSNVADLVMNFGSVDTASYLRIQNDKLESSVDPKLLDRVAGRSREFARAERIGSLHPTGSAGYARNAVLAQMANLATLPGGTQSIAYQEKYAEERGLRSSQFSQSTLSGYGLRSLELEGQRARQEYLPFSPGNRFATNIGVVVNNRQQIGRLDSYLSNPDLSEQERYQRSAERQDLFTQNARSIGEISEGFENRLPALSAGRPGFFGRYSSLQGAARQLGEIGSPVRFAGAVGGRQVRFQQGIFEALGGDASLSPYSTTANLNNPHAPVNYPAGHSTPATNMNPTNDILMQIRDLLKGSGGGGKGAGMRPAEAYGNTAAGIDSKRGDLGQERVYQSR
jgi:hypothetical protein